MWIQPSIQWNTDYWIGAINFSIFSKSNKGFTVGGNTSKEQKLIYLAIGI